MSDVVRPDLVVEAVRELKAFDKFVVYANESERKKTTRDYHEWAASMRCLYDELTRRSFIEQLEEVTGMRGLVCDPTIHGGGYHVTERGGHLGPHIDYAVHPVMPILQRKLNLILYLNELWKPEWGGQTVFWNDDATVRQGDVCPEFNTALLWAPGDTTFHSVNPVDFSANEPRYTLAIYYLGVKDVGANRKRALFVPERKPA